MHVPKKTECQKRQRGRHPFERFASSRAQEAKVRQPGYTFLECAGKGISHMQLQVWRTAAGKQPVCTTHIKLPAVVRAKTVGVPKNRDILPGIKITMVSMPPLACKRDVGL